ALKCSRCMIMLCGKMPMININPIRYWKLREYCNPRDNEVLESHRFGTFVQEPLKNSSRSSNESSVLQFSGERRDYEDKIVFTVTGKLQELLLRVDSLTLEKQ
ncbi:hypothetical protein OS493_040537, partial [Desmophyllum pertusum]